MIIAIIFGVILLRVFYLAFKKEDEWWDRQRKPGWK